MGEAQPKFKTVKAAALYFATIVDHIDPDDQRPVGLSYSQILERVKIAVPKILYPGPHKNRRMKTTKKQLREYIYVQQSIDRDWRLPKRPRSIRVDALPDGTDTRKQKEDHHVETQS